MAVDIEGNRVAQIQTDRARGTGRARDLGEASRMAARGATTAITAAKDVTTEVLTGKLQGEAEGEWNRYIRSKNLLQANTRALTDLEALAGSQASEGKRDAVRNTLEAADKLRRQVVLGNLTPAEAKVHSRDVLARHINENPMFRAELIAAHDQIMGLHKDQLSVIIQQEGLGNKKENDRLVGQARTIILEKGQDQPQSDSDALEQATRIKNLEEKRNQVELGIVDAAADKTEMMTTGGHGEANVQSLRAGLTGLTNAYYDKGSELNSPDDFAREVNLLLSDHKQYINNNFSNAEKRVVDSHMDVLDLISKTVIDGISQNKSLEKIQTSVGIMEETMIQNAYLDSGIMRAMYVLNEVGGNMDLPASILKYGDDATGHKTIMRYISGVMSGDTHFKSTPRGVAVVKGASDLINATIPKYADMSEPEKEGFREILNKFTDTLDSGQYSQENADLVAKFASSKDFLDLVKNDPTMISTAGKVSDNVTKYVQDGLMPRVISEFKRDLEKFVPVTDEKGGDLPLSDFMIVDVSPSGILTIKPANLDNVEGIRGVTANVAKTKIINAVRNISDKYGARFNQAAKAVAHANGTEDLTDAMPTIFTGLVAEGLPKFTGAIGEAPPVPVDPVPTLVEPEPATGVMTREEETTFRATPLGKYLLNEMGAGGQRASTASGMWSDFINKRAALDED